MKRRHILSLLIVLLVATVSAINTMHPLFRSTRNITINCFYKDADGILWCGTSMGLLTYAQIQGQNPLGYERDEAMRQTIVEITQDNKLQLWLASRERHYIIYNPRTNTVITDVNSYLADRGIKVTYELHVDADRKGMLWLASGDKVYLRDELHNKTQQFSLPKNEEALLIRQQGKNATVITRDDVYYINSQNSKVQRLTQLPEAFNDSHLRCSWAGSRLWLTDGQKLFIYDHATKSWTNRTENLRGIQGLENGVNGDMIVYTSNNGYYVYDPQAKEYLHIFDHSDDKRTLPSSHINSMYYDHERGQLLMAFVKHGMAMVSTRNEAFTLRQIVDPNNNDPNDIICMAESKDHHIWMGTEDHGIYKVDAMTGKSLDHRYDGASITAVLEDSKGRLWTGQYNDGLSCSDGSKFLKGQSPYSIKEGADGLLYIELLGNGVQQFNPATGEIKPLPTNIPWIMDIAQRGSKLYYSSPTYLYIYDTKTHQCDSIDAKKISNDCKNYSSKQLFIDSRQWLWTVNYQTPSTVYIYDILHRKPVRSSYLSKYLVKAIREDAEGNIIMSTNNGVVRVEVLDTKNPTFRRFCFNEKQSGDQPFYNDGAMIALKNGTLAIGTTFGYQTIQLDQSGNKKSKEDESPLILTSATINGRQLSPNVVYKGDTIIHCDIPYLKELKLDYTQHNLEFEVHSRNVSDKIYTYFYKVEGETDWLPIREGMITLNDMKHGKYNIIIRQRNIINGETNDYDLISVTITPPFWATWWAILLYLLIIGFIAFAFYYYKRSRKHFAVLLDKYMKERVELELASKKLNEEKEHIAETVAKAAMNESENESAEESAEEAAPKEIVIEPQKIETVSDDDKFVQEAMAIVEEHMSDTEFNVDTFAQLMSMHRTSLHRKLVLITGLSPARFIRLMRMKRARQLLEGGNRMVSQVAYQVGYNSTKNFSHHFREQFGFNPSEIEL